MWLELIYYVLVSAIYAFYKWATVNKDYFSTRGISHLKPKFLIGNTFGLLSKQYKPTEFLDSIYYRFPNEKLVGFFDSRDPVYFACDTDFIRQITIKDFDNFEDHIGFIETNPDTLFGRTLFLMSEKKWRQMRATLSPAFTSSKMRQMFELVVECANDMINHLAEDANQAKPIRWEIKQLFSRYISDVIATCAFGLKVNSLKDQTNEFFTIGTSNLDFGTMKVATRLFLVRKLPMLMRAIDFEFFPANIRRFFKSMVIDTMKEREKNNIFRPDMIQLLMQVRSGNLKQQEEETCNDDVGFATVEESKIGKLQVNRNWTDDEIVAQCFLFYAAGFDTSSTFASFFAYELAVNEDIQQKVYEEIRTFNAGLNGDRLTYEALSKLKYFDQVINETLRKWPPAIFTNRKCTKDYEFDYNGQKVLIERGKSIWIPIYSIHRDPEIYENPSRFDPERFSDENKLKIKSGSFIPFGIGPRNCIASRFALMEVKALFFYLLLNFNIQSYERTQIPIKIAKAAFNLNTEQGIHLELKQRL